MPGCLSETQTYNLNSGFQAFLRLVGTLYFKKNLPVFASEYGFATPNQLFNSLDTVPHKHKIKSEMSLLTTLYVKKKEYHQIVHCGVTG